MHMYYDLYPIDTRTEMERDIAMWDQIDKQNDEDDVPNYCDDVDYYDNEHIWIKDNENDWNSINDYLG